MKVYIDPRVYKSAPDLAGWVHKIKCATSFWDALALMRRKMKHADAKGFLLVLNRPCGVSDPHKTLLELLTETRGERHEQIMVEKVVRSGRRTRVYKAPLNGHGRSMPHSLWASMSVRKV